MANNNPIQAAAGDMFSQMLNPLVRTVTMGVNQVAPANLIGPDQLLDAYLQGLTSTPNFVAMMRTCHGIDTHENIGTFFYEYRLDNGTLRYAEGEPYTLDGNNAPGIVAADVLPPIDMLFDLANRGFLSDPMLDHMLKRSKIRSQSMRTIIGDLKNQIPGPSDLVRFAVREAFNPVIVQQYGYHHELPKAILPWMKSQGYGWDLPDARPAGATWDDGTAAAGQQSWFDKFWFSHWELPSVTQAMEMMYRLYPNSRFGPSPSIIAGNTFTEGDFSTLLKVQDYPDYWRAKMTAVAYQPLTRVDVKRMFKLGVMTAQEVYHAYRQIGYDDQNAKRLMDFTIEDSKPKPRLLKSTITAAKVCEMVNEGIINRDTAIGLLNKLGYRLADIVFFLDNCQLTYNLGYFKEIFKTLKRAYFKGRYTIQQIRTTLEEYNFTPEVIEKKTKLWMVQRDAEITAVSAERAIKLFKQGLLREPELQTRLFNLNYQGTDITLIIKQAKLEFANDYNLRTFKRAKEIAKKVKAELKRRVAILKAAIKSDEAGLDKLLAHTTPAILKALYVAGAVNLDTLKVRLKVSQGWTDEMVNQWIYAILGEKDDTTNAKTTKAKAATATAKSDIGSGQDATGHNLSGKGDVQTPTTNASQLGSGAFRTGQAIDTPVQRLGG